MNGADSKCYGSCGVGDILENLDDQGRVLGEGWFGGRIGLREVEGPANRQEDISGSSSVGSHARHLVSLLAYATLVQKGPGDSDSSLLPLTQGFMSIAQCPDFMVTDWSPPGAHQKCAPAVPWSSNTHLPLSPTGVARVCFHPLHPLFLCVSVEFKVLDLICNLFVYCPKHLPVLFHSTSLSSLFFVR